MAQRKIMERQNNTYYNSLTVTESLLHGKGLFTTVDIPKDHIVIIIEGEVISGEECERREEEENNVYIFDNEPFYIDTSATEKIKFINHSFEPNCYVEEKDEHSLYLIAEKDIKAGEELTIDYDYDGVEEFNNSNVVNTAVNGK